MEASSQGSSANRPSDSTRPSSTIRCGKSTGVSASHTEQSIDDTKATKTPDKENPLNLEPHPILVQFTGEATKQRSVDAFSKNKLQVLLASLPIVEVVLMRGRYWVIRDWEAVRLARRHKTPSISMRILTFSTKEKLRDYIYLTCFISTQVVRGRQLSTFRANLNTIQVESKSELLTGSTEQQRMNGMPVSTGYRLKGPTPGTKRGRKKKQGLSLGGLQSSDHPTSAPAMTTPPEPHAKEGHV